MAFAHTSAPGGTRRARKAMPLPKTWTVLTPGGGQHPLECSIAALPVSLRLPPPRANSGHAVGPAAESFLGVAFAAASWLRELGKGKCAVRCPWAQEHSRDGRDGSARSDGEDSSAALLPPTMRCASAPSGGGTAPDEHPQCAPCPSLRRRSLAPHKPIPRHTSALYRLARPTKGVTP